MQARVVGAFGALDGTETSPGRFRAASVVLTGLGLDVGQGNQGVGVTLRRCDEVGSLGRTCGRWKGALVLER